MDIRQIKFRPWMGVKVEPLKKDVWSEAARRGTVMLQVSGKKAHALFVDDDGGIRESLAIEAELVDELIAAAARSWMERGTNGSFTVVANLKDRGDVAPRPVPQPGPGPVGEDLIRSLATMGHFQLLGLAEVAEVMAGFGRQF